jgi:hypothetical protein
MIIFFIFFALFSLIEFIFFYIKLNQIRQSISTIKSVVSNSKYSDVMSLVIKKCLLYRKHLWIFYTTIVIINCLLSLVCAGTIITVMHLLK